MSPAPWIQICARWQGRCETSASMVARLETFMLHSVIPGRSWYGRLPSGATVDLSSEFDLLPNFLATCEEYDRQGEVGIVPGKGGLCCLSALADGVDDDRSDPSLNSWWGSPSHNHLQIDSCLGGTSDPRYISYEIIRANVLATAAAFEPEWCEAGPVALRAYHDREVYNRPPVGLSWMVWLCPAYAGLVQPPPSYTHIIVEPMTDGSLFMATGKPLFDCSNHLHLDRAREIHRRIDPLNYTLPFDGQWGRSNRVPPFPKL